MKKIFQISKADEFGGGASKVAAQLNTLLNKKNINSKHLASWAGHGFNQKTEPLYKNHFRIISKLHFYIKKIGFAELVPFEYLTIDKDRELYHFHDLSSAVSPNTIRLLLAKGKKVVWTIHDCSPFTGGCLYPMDCQQYKTSCGNCPQLGSWPIDSKFDFTQLNYDIKNKLHKHKNLTIICPSQWMADFAKQSGMSVNDPVIIPNAVDRTIYTPKSTYEEITSYEGVKVILSAGDIADKRKGVFYALRVLEKLSHLNPLLVIIGNVSPEFDEQVNSFNRVYCGYVSSPEKMAKYLASADLFLFCSLADNMPLSILESLSCATPVFGFKTGGMPEMIDNGVNGYLSERYDTEGLAENIIEVVSSGNIERMKEQSLLSSGSYDESIFVDRHIQLYKEILS